MNFDVRISSQITEVAPIWRAFEETGVSTPFQTRAWLLPLYDTLAVDNRAEPLFVTVRDEDGRPLMFLPLCRRRNFGARVVQFPDFGVSDYNAPMLARDRVVEPGDRAALMRAVIGAIGDAQALQLDKMPLQIGGLDNPLATLDGAREIPAHSWGFDLPSTLADYEKMLASTFRKEINRKRRRTAGRGAVTFNQAGSHDEKLAVFDVLFRQRQQRCDEMGRFHVLSDPRFRRFYETMLRRDDTHDFAAVHALRVGDEVVATTLSLRHANTRSVLMTTFASGEWKSCSLGNVVLYASIADSIARGESYFDLTIGNEGYKKDFAATPKPLHTLTRAVSILGLPHAAIHAAKRAIRKAMPEEAA